MRGAIASRTGAGLERGLWTSTRPNRLSRSPRVESSSSRVRSRRFLPRRHRDGAARSTGPDALSPREARRNRGTGEMGDRLGKPAARSSRASGRGTMDNRGRRRRRSRARSRRRASPLTPPFPAKSRSSRSTTASSDLGSTRRTPSLRPAEKRRSRVSQRSRVISRRWKMFSPASSTPCCMRFGASRRFSWRQRGRRRGQS